MSFFIRAPPKFESDIVSLWQWIAPLENSLDCSCRT